MVTEPTPLPGGLIGVNSFGFGGSNTHAILRVCDHEAQPVQPSSLTRLVLYSGRTQEGVANIFNAVDEHKDDAYFLQLLANNVIEV